MPRKAHRLVLGIEAIVGQSADIMSGDLHCAVCGKTNLKHKLTLVQYGFVADSYTELYKCRDCKGYTTFIYAVKVEITPDGLIALDELENNT